MASVLPRPATRTTSRCVTRKVRATHAFEINDYSVHRALGRGKFLSSAAFNVGGYSWCILFYPNGSSQEEAKGHVSVFLNLLTTKAEVRALYDLRMVNQVTGSSCSIFSNAKPTVFSTQIDRESNIWGRLAFIKTSDLESSRYLKGDRLVIECDVTVIEETRVVVEEDHEVQVPPSSLPQVYGKLLETGEASDVTFIVEAEVFHVPKLVLAARSPVFKAELQRPAGKENKTIIITIEDMQPAVFRALLHFIYTDTMPSMDHRDGKGNKEFVRHLLVAADRYAMDSLKLMCEQILCKHVDVDSVAQMLVLADQLSCINLKDACLKHMEQSRKPKKVMCCYRFR